MCAKVCSKGVVTAIEPDAVLVRVARDSEGCEACAIAALCGKGEVIRVPYAEPGLLSVGDTVSVIFSGGKASVWLTVPVPWLILVVVAVGLQWMGVPEVWCVLGSVFALGLWYAVVHYIYSSRRFELLRGSGRYSDDCGNTD